MSLPGRQYHLRIPRGLAEKLDAVASEFPSLPTPVLMRLLLSVTLSKPLPEQIKAIQAEIRRGPPNPGKSE